MASKVEEIRNLSAEDRAQKLKDLRDEQFNLRFQHSTGQLENTARMRQVRREIAQVKTVMNEQVEAAE
ncbi:50S ribosomal protein L29 [Thiohalorhabdus denitrificans]|uniref:Large ribosomal subunit protein uL29 n=1 Tax=Thiohalorhabdus denitrificans TaxID=381306 RepID=A0A0P9CWC0_9GAMM|nr:50S ribosomal protein L29 [Thiohalorhabdus denitrificans]KPV40962.1 50S ribosomal protein L29 [Thiohalorhabdus denitrificans]SCY43250.1 LSU ribosomal protein L29P [Thiohalorhabdus denitrificans]